MNRYHDLRNDCCRNDYYENLSKYDNYSGNNYYDYNTNDNYYHNKPSCCVRKVEETYCCFPSYYNEDKKEDNKSQIKCCEGTFKICPKHCYDEKPNDNKCIKHNETNYCNCTNQNDCYEKDYSNHNRQQHKCCFCNLFKNCRW